MEFLNLAFPYLLEVIVTIVITAIGIAGTYLAAKAAQHKGLENTQVAINMAADAAGWTVRKLQQTLVDGWKAAGGGKLSDAQVDELKYKLVAMSKEILTPAAIKLLEAAEIDSTTLIQSYGEAMVQIIKGESKTN